MVKTPLLLGYVTRVLSVRLMSAWASQGVSSASGENHGLSCMQGHTKKGFYSTSVTTHIHALSYM